MKKHTHYDRAVAYVNEHPGAQSRDVASALDITPPHAANVLTGLERRGLLVSRPAYASGTGYRRKFYPADSMTRARVVANRAQSIGGPFGILVAQLVR